MVAGRPHNLLRVEQDRPARSVEDARHRGRRSARHAAGRQDRDRVAGPPIPLLREAGLSFGVDLARARWRRRGKADRRGVEQFVEFRRGGSRSLFSLPGRCAAEDVDRAVRLRHGKADDTAQHREAALGRHGTLARPAVAAVLGDRQCQAAISCWSTSSGETTGAAGTRSPRVGRRKTRWPA